MEDGKNHVDLQPGRGKHGGWTGELLWCSCYINSEDTWRFHMSTEDFPETLLTVDLKVVKQAFITAS